MNHGVVLDASVAVKWVLVEDGSESALRLYDDSVRRGRTVLAPPILPAEVTNAVLQQHRRAQLSSERADEALTRFFAFRFRLLESPMRLYQDALAFSRAHGLKNAYDSLYLVLAEGLDVELWTADRRFFDAVRAISRRVRWLGDYG